MQQEFLMMIRASLLTILSTFVAFGTACTQKGGDSGAYDLRIDDDLAELDPARSSWEGTAEGVGHHCGSGSSGSRKPRRSP
jgi:hypothetical protein